MTTTQNPTTARANVTTLTKGDTVTIAGAQFLVVGDPIHVTDDSVTPAEALVDIEVESVTGYRWFIQRPTWASLPTVRAGA
jgi:hypothetical protein